MPIAYKVFRRDESGALTPISFLGRVIQGTYPQTNEWLTAKVGKFFLYRRKGDAIQYVTDHRMVRNMVAMRVEYRKGTDVDRKLGGLDVLDPDGSWTVTTGSSVTHDIVKDYWDAPTTYVGRRDDIPACWVPPGVIIAKEIRILDEITD